MYLCICNFGHAQPRAGAWSQCFAQLRTRLRICVANRDDNAAKAAANNANRSRERNRQPWHYISAAKMLRQDCISAAIDATRPAAWNDAYLLHCL